MRAGFGNGGTAGFGSRSLMVGQTHPGDAVDAHGPPVALGIATADRPMIVAETLAHLARLDDQPDKVVVSVSKLEDCAPAILPGARFALELLVGPPGAAAQRNAILRRLPPAAIALFLDDDFLIEDGYITRLRRLLTQDHGIAMVTGTVIADGLRGPGYTAKEGAAMLAHAPPPPSRAESHDVYAAYGCNMAMRADLPRQKGIEFDEALPLYSWLEDMGFSREMARHGRIVRDTGLRGIHLATKIGRTAGIRLGYSQIANPLHLWRHGKISAYRGLRLMLRNIAANTAKSINPEPWIDRRGRLNGNLTALRDLVRGRCDPRRILEFGENGPPPVVARVTRYVPDAAQTPPRWVRADPDRD